MNLHLQGEIPVSSPLLGSICPTASPRRGRSLPVPYTPVGFCLGKVVTRRLGSDAEAAAAGKAHIPCKASTSSTRPQTLAPDEKRQSAADAPALLLRATSGSPPGPRANRLRALDHVPPPDASRHLPRVTACNRAGNSRQIERRAVHSVGFRDAGREGTPSRCRKSSAPGRCDFPALPRRFHSIIRDMSVRCCDGRHSASEAAS
jgi:hypothetical protein